MGLASEQFGKYLLLHKIATGGMAEIHLSLMSGLAGFEKLIVIKRILPTFAGEQNYVDMFLDEARLAASMAHPNVVHVYDLGRVDSSIYLAMEYIAGQDLAHVLKTCKRSGKIVPYPLVARIISDACAGLHYAHTLRDARGNQLNVIHRDISPGNLLVSYDGVTKVLDFGVARSETHVVKTEQGTLKGKLAYLAPEQVQRNKFDARVDVWALGVVMWEALLVRRLFRGDNELRLATQITSDPILSPLEIAPIVPPILAEIAMQALQRDPKKRYPSAQAMRDDLEGYLRSLDAPTTTADVAAFMKTLFADEYSANERLLRDVPHATPGELADLAKLAEQESSPSFSAGTGSIPFPQVGGWRRPSRIRAAAISAAVIAAAAVGWAVLRPNADRRDQVGTVDVVTEPAGADVYLDGTRQVPSPVTIGKVTADVEHTIIVDKEGYEVVNRTLTVAANKKQRVTLVLTAKVAATTPASVKLVVISTPPGARVSRADSGQGLGATPLDTSVPSATEPLVLRLQLAGYEPAERKVTLHADTSLEVALVKTKSATSSPSGKKPKKPKPEGSADDLVDAFAQ